MEAVFKGSCQALVNEAQNPVGHGGNLPVITGFLRASPVASIGGPTPINRAGKGEKDQSYTWNTSPLLATLATLQTGQVFFFCWTAVYARVVEYGGPGRVGRGFVRRAAQRWRFIVSAEVKKAKQAARR